MLRPTKHSHPDRTVINASLLLLVRIKKRRLEKYEELLKFIKKSCARSDELFLPALSFLYLMGLIEYRPKVDSIEYVGSNETV